MIKCPSCSFQAAEGSNYCPSCGEMFPSAQESPTIAASSRQKDKDKKGYRERTMAERTHWNESSDVFLESRFLPGMILAGRYRIVSLLGKGGMGEVYRAEDLKLGQPVALKFLPEELESDEEQLNRFLTEVKLSRQVSHPNVCRVYDVSEIEGQHYLSMEYVDGEDLASLLKRIGRLPRDRAIIIARQICSGLAAAHDQGILHRDLKPANIMIDSRGRARITDFGLASLVERVRKGDVRAGTPGYMAPEQIAGKDVTVRSDIYSLGLVLYELFTGKKAFKASNAVELKRMQEESTPPSPTSFMEGFDPVIERVIFRCLERDPLYRPGSALAVAAALPGGDPLAASIAAGETPSPEMVAAAGGSGSLKTVFAVPVLVFTLAMLLFIAFLSEKYSMLGYVPLTKAPEVLIDRAHQIIASAGYSGSFEDSEYGFSTTYDEYLEYIKNDDSSLNRWDRLSTDQPTVITFWYRQSPRSMIATDTSGKIRFRDPPIETSGMVNLCLDTQGRLIFFMAVPPQVDEAESEGYLTDWNVLFTEAGLNIGDFTETKPRWLPEVYGDSRQAWEGTYPDQSEPMIRIEASSYMGKPVYFDIVHPFDRAWRMIPAMETMGQKAQTIINAILVAGAIIGAFFLARYNLLHGRGDKKGAFRIAIYYIFLQMVSWLILCNHVLNISEELWQFIKAMGIALFIGGFIWLMYVALEPFIRRQWPESIVSWTRLISGRFRDPLVGQHLLLGATIGTIIGFITLIEYAAPTWFGLAPIEPLRISADSLHGARGMVGTFFRVLAALIFQPMIHLFLLVLFRVILRRWWIAFLAYISIIAVFESLTSEYLFLNLLFVIPVFILIVFCLFRFGLVAAMISFLIVSFIHTFPLTLDFSKWYAPNTILALCIVGAIVLYAFSICLERRPLLQPEMEMD